MSKQWFFVLFLVLAMATGTAATQDDSPVQIIFMHHSTGAGVMNDGGVRESLTNLGYDFWDHDYNEWGLSGPTGDNLGVNWNVPDDNTDPDGWFAIFNQPITVAEVTEATSWGAAILGGLGAGVYADVASALDTIQAARRTVEPVADQVEFYEAYYRQVYQKIYETLRPLHHDIYRLQHGN